MCCSGRMGLATASGQQRTTYTCVCIIIIYYFMFVRAVSDESLVAGSSARRSLLFLARARAYWRIERFHTAVIICVLWMRARSRPIFKVRKRRCGELALYVCARHKVRPRICVLISPAGPRSARYYCSNKDALFVLADAQSRRYTHTLYNITSDIFYEKY